MSTTSSLRCVTRISGDNVDEKQSEQQKDLAPAYKKPTLRRYDQIEQVKPYGPSERKAG